MRRHHRGVLPPIAEKLKARGWREAYRARSRLGSLCSELFGLSRGERLRRLAIPPNMEPSRTGLPAVATSSVWSCCSTRPHGLWWPHGATAAAAATGPRASAARRSCGACCGSCSPTCAAPTASAWRCARPMAATWRACSSCWPLGPISTCATRPLALGFDEIGAGYRAEPIGSYRIL